MNAYEKSIELGLTGEPAEIVASLRATGLTERKISLAYLTDLLRTRKMLTKLSYEDPETKMKWSGSVIHMIVTLRDSGHPELPMVNQWFGHITDPRAEYFDTSIPEFAAPFWLLSQSVAGGEGMPSVEDFAAVSALGGGWLYAALTVEEFAAQKAAAIAKGDRDQLDSEWKAILNDGGINVALSTGDRSGLKAALAAAIEVL